MSNLKEIPQKLGVVKYRFENGVFVHDTWCCPLCSAEHKIEYDIYNYQPNYCPNCKQRIDWGR